MDDHPRIATQPNSNRVMLKIILAGYRAEVRGEVIYPN